LQSFTALHILAALLLCFYVVQTLPLVTFVANS